MLGIRQPSPRGYGRNACDRFDAGRTIQPELISGGAYLTLFIHFRIGPVTESSLVLGENTSDIWL